jgi:hypothetical protein
MGSSVKRAGGEAVGRLADENSKEDMTETAGRRGDIARLDHIHPGYAASNAQLQAKKAARCTTRLHFRNGGSKILATMGHRW